MPPLCHTWTLQHHLKFCSKQVKTSYLDWHARTKPNHHLLQYFFINTVTEHEKSMDTLGVEPGSLRWESVLYQWVAEVLSTESH